MTIGILTIEYPPTLGGVARSVRRIARNLADGGFTVRVVVLPNAQTAVADHPDDLASHESDGCVEVFRLSPPPHAPTLRKRCTTAYYEWLCDFAKTIDIMNCFYVSETGFIGGMAAKLAGIPFVASVRGNDIHQSLFDPDQLPQIEWTLRHADALTFVATPLRDEAYRVHPFSAPACVIWNSVNPADFDAGEAARCNFDRPVVGMAGELRYKKGLDRLLNVCASLDQSVELLLGGEFNVPEAVYWRGAVERARREGASITLAGLVPYHEMLGFYRSADVMAFPARHDGCPNALLEAMLVGRACLCTRVGAMGEIMDASGAGMVVDPFSIDAFRSALTLLVKDGPLRTELGARAREFVLCRLSPERECTAWKALYNSFR